MPDYHVTIIQIPIQTSLIEWGVNFWVADDSKHLTSHLSYQLASCEMDESISLDLNLSLCLSFWLIMFICCAVLLALVF